MNLTKLFNTQRILDARIEKEHPRVEGEDRLAKKILALQVELGECANEWRGFKFWSKDQEPRTKVFDEEYDLIHMESIGLEQKNPLLEEYVDCLHFILSIGNELKFHYGDFYTTHKQSTREQFMYTIQKASNLNSYHTLGNYEMLFCSFLALGEMLGFNWEQIEQAYYDKNAINHTRQDTGY